LTAFSENSYDTIVSVCLRGVTLVLPGSDLTETVCNKVLQNLSVS